MREGKKKWERNESFFFSTLEFVTAERKKEREIRKRDEATIRENSVGEKRVDEKFSFRRTSSTSVRHGLSFHPRMVEIEQNLQDLERWMKYSQP